MGEVYRARDTRLGRTVAIKILPAAFAADAERLQRFEHEARLLSSLNHPNILAIHDVGSEDGLHYLVSEYLEGQTLRERMESGPLPARKVTDYGIQMAKGLAAAHEKGIVHRDLKPENIFVTRDDRVKVLDFGLAKQTQAARADEATMTSPHTAAGMVMGTVGYMSPEQVKGEPADHRADIFSLGAILYEMVSGKRAFRRDTAVETMNAILKEDPPEVEGSGAHPSPGLERIMRRCLEKAPEQRFQSASDLGFALEAVSGISGPSAAQLAQVPVQHPRRLGLAIAGAAVGVVLLVAAVWMLAVRGSGARAQDVSYKVLNFRSETIFRAAFASDGKTVIYSAASVGNTPEIFTIRPEYPEGRSMGLGGATFLAVSSNGELAVLTKAQYVAHRMFMGTLGTMPLGSQAPREIAENVRDAAWTPDGSGLAIIREVDGQDQLEYPIGKVLYKTSGYVNDLRFSPDGKTIAFLEHLLKFDDRGFVAVVDMEGNHRVLTGDYWGEEGLAWSADGKEILFSAGTGYENFFINAVDLSGKVRIALTSAGGLAIHDVARDGRWLATRDDVRKRVVGKVPGSDKEVDLSWLDLSGQIILSPDGNRLLFSEQSGALGVNYAVCLRQTDGSGVVQLGEGTPGGFSPDGKWALATVPSSPQKVVLYPTGPGSSRIVDEGGLTNYGRVSFFPDGKRVLICGSSADKTTRCYSKDIDGGDLRPVTPEGTTDGAVSPDGGKVLAHALGKGWFLYPLDSGAPQPLSFLASNDVVIDWSRDGKSIYTHRWGPVPTAIERVEIASGRRTLIHKLAPTDPAGVLVIQGATLTPDEKWYAYEARVMTSRFFLVSGAQ